MYSYDYIILLLYSYYTIIFTNMQNIGLSRMMVIIICRCVIAT